MSDNTLFLRLAGPMQSWGTASRFQLRRTDAYPSKSGVLGLLLCAKGVCRSESPAHLKRLNPLTMGVRVDRSGKLDWDYHTAGGGHGKGRERAVGSRSADGKIKKTAATGEYEPLLSRRQYLWDASFLVGLQGNPALIADCAAALGDPVWPIFLGRKCCVPAEPVFAGTGSFDSLTHALSSRPWQPRIEHLDNPTHASTQTLDCFLEHAAGVAPPKDARVVHDEPKVFGYYSHGPRLVVASQLTVAVGPPIHPRRPRPVWVDPYGPEWEDVRKSRLALDNGLCVFCKSPATQVHHLDYQDVRVETVRSLCDLCHEACTILEYGSGRRQRIDPMDPIQRPRLLEQIEKLLEPRPLNRRTELLTAVRVESPDIFRESPVS